jgi:uncharacterized membrane protein
MEYLVMKWLHVLSATVLFGAGVGSAFHLFAAALQHRVPAIAGACRNVVLADKWLTTPSAVFQPVSGLWLAHTAGLPWSTPWLAASLALYALAIACWLVVVWVQLRLRDLAAQSERSGSDLPATWWRLFHWWVGLGVVALVAFLAIFWLMVARRLG